MKNTTLQTANEESLVSLAGILSPGMARALEKLVGAYLFGVRPQINEEDNRYLICAAAALSAINRTPGAATEIGRGAAKVMWPQASGKKLLGLGCMAQKQLR